MTETDMIENITEMITDELTGNTTTMDIVTNPDTIHDVVIPLADTFTANAESVFRHIMQGIHDAAQHLSPDVLTPYLEQVPFLKLFPPHTYAAMVFLTAVSCIVWKGGRLAKWIFGVSCAILGLMLGLDVVNYFMT